MQSNTMVTLVGIVFCAWLIEQSHAYPKGSELQSGEVDCSQFTDDADIIRQFPYKIAEYEGETFIYHSVIMTNEDTKVIDSIFFYKEEIVPPSVFCLSHLERLSVSKTPFLNDILPEALTKLKNLTYLTVSNSKIAKGIEHVTKLPKLEMLILNNCSLTSLPNLSHMSELGALLVENNSLTDITGIPGVQFLELTGTQIKNIPMTSDPDRLIGLDMSGSPVSSAAAIMSYKNLEDINLSNTEITSIPATIDKLTNITKLRLSDNKLTHLPTNILNLRQLEELDIKNNRLSKKDVESIRRSFKKSHPKLKIKY